MRGQPAKVCMSFGKARFMMCVCVAGVEAMGAQEETAFQAHRVQLSVCCGSLPCPCDLPALVFRTLPKNSPESLYLAVAYHLLCINVLNILFLIFKQSCKVCARICSFRLRKQAYRLNNLTGGPQLESCMGDLGSTSLMVALKGRRSPWVVRTTPALLDGH